MSEKPLSNKKLKRMMRKQKIEDKKKSNSASSEAKLPKEWQKPPKNLKGKELGLWHRDKMRWSKLLKKSAESPEIERKISKKEKKALKMQRGNEEADLLQHCYKVVLDLNRQEMVKDYLETTQNSAPSFLIPLNEYHKRIKKKRFESCKTKPTIKVEDDEKKNDAEASLSPEDLVSKSKELYRKFPVDAVDELSVPLIEKFLENRKVCDSDSKSSFHSDLSSSSSSYCQIEGSVIDQDDGVLDSMDKYKHLEETPFKQKFMDILSQNIQSKLEKAVRHNMALQRNKNLDREFCLAFASKESIPKYRSMSNARQQLPAYKMRKEILQLINDNQVSLISGETGCGKTTQVAQFILDEALSTNNGSVCNIMCTQPRRISAISVSQRVADERAEIIGRESVGYQIRLEKKIGRSKGAILFCTTGILLQHMQGDPALKKYSHIILDEIHERDIMCDFVLTILRDVIAKRSDLKIVLMSATLNAEQFSQYFYNCPSINIPGYTYPVEECYLEEVLMVTKYVFPKNAKKKNRDFEDDESFKTHVVPYALQLKKAKKYPDSVIDGLMNPESERVNADLIVSLIEHICGSKDAGAILIFVPGWEDINAVMKKLSAGEKFPPSKFLIIPLHSMLPTAAQQSVFDRPAAGVRKIVVATNIAETSITIDDVVFVIDCGKIKIKNYDVVNNISTLKPEFVSLANARQRRGRAGRVRSGVCYHLFSRARERLLADYPLPEMLRTRLEEVILNIKLLQLGKAGPFLSKVMDPPNSKTVLLALQLLRQLNALDENENLTPLGFHLAKLPLDPQIGKMLLMGVTMSCLNPILSIAATLSYKDPFYLPLGEEKLLKERKLELDQGRKSDHLIMAEVLDRWEEEEKRFGRNRGMKFCEHNYLIRNTLYSLRDLKYQFAQYLCEMGFLKDANYKQECLNKNSKNIALLKAVICSGLYPNVAIIKRKINSKARIMVLLRTSEDGNVTLHQKSVNTGQQQDFESCFLVYHEKLRSSCIFIFETTMVSPLPLLLFCDDFFFTTVDDKAVIQLNKDLKFSCDLNTANLIVELRHRLIWLLEYKLLHPGHVSWNDNSNDIKCLKILTELFTTENNGIMGATKYDSSE